ncbi:MULTISPECIES: hypothetical protein [unclassified Achromobacter]|uniref:hypothetical protein n=1 Tax=unclassified Achromobacter TaxID=2626865 RepID=UPI000B518DA4|nr:MULTISPECIES: hypothetical protein [unclassified Achromobacter]OWT80087.1 hypothetical protein CEY05_01250 [Achromobacter sp. HZ34]OWT81970.1 hypothetical protein CEY04_01250 [Achromobacter sp. HZ28]
MSITINEELRAYIDPLTEDEYAALERSLLAEGCRDALVLWGDVLVDGHNRYAICQKHGIPFNTVQNARFQSLEDVHLWMIDNQLGRRSVSDFQRGLMALRKKEIMALRRVRAQARRAAEAEGGDGASAPAPQQQEGDAPFDDHAGQVAPTAQDTHSGADGAATAAGAMSEQEDPAAGNEPPWDRQTVARVARVTPATLTQIEKIQKTAAPELVDAIKSGVISINAAAAVASLPAPDQVAAVAGGKKELRAAARQVREARAPAKPPRPDLPEPPADATPEQLQIHQLMREIADLKDERDQLKKKIQQMTIALAQARGEGGD